MGFRYKTRYIALLATLSVLLGFNALFAAAISSNGTGGGNWNTGSTWAGGVVPGAGDDVTIVAGDVVTLDVSPATVTSLTIASTATFDINANTLNVTGAVTINGSFDDLSGGGTLNLGGDFTINSGGLFNDSGNGISIDFNGSATQTISGTYNGATIEFYDFTVSGTGTVDNNLSSDVIVNTLNMSSGTFLAGTATYTIGASNLNQAVFNKTGGTFTAETSTIKIASTVNVKLSIDANTSFYSIEHAPPTGARTLSFDETNAGSAVYTITNSLLFSPNSKGASFNNGASIAYSGTTTLSYTTGNAITIGNEWPATNSPTNVTVNSSATFTLGSNRTVSGTFTHTGGGTFDVSAGTLTINGTFAKGSGSFTLSGGALTYGSSALLRYDAGQTAGAEWLGTVPNVTVQSGTVTLTAGSGTRTITNTLTVTSTLSANNNALSAGALTVNGTLQTDNANVTVTNGTSLGTSATMTTNSSGAGTGGNLSTATLSLGDNATLTTNGGTVDASSTTTMNGGATINSGAGAVTLVGDVTMGHQSQVNATGTIRMDGNLTISGTGIVGQSAAGTLVMNGNSTTNVSIDGIIQLFNFTVNKTGGNTVQVSTTSGSQMRFNTNGTLRVQQGILALSSTSQILDVNGGSISNDNLTLQVDANGTFQTGGTDIAGFATFTLADGSTVEFNGTSAEDIPSATYGNITVSNSHSNGATMVGNVTLQTNSTISVSASSRLNLGGVTITNAGASDALSVASGADLYTDGTSLSGFNSYTFSGTVHFNGSSQETSPGGVTFANIEVNNSGGLVLGGATTVSTLITFTNGKITSTSANLLTLAAGATASPTSTSFVTGPVARQTDGATTSFVFPVGIGTSLRTVTLSFTSAPANSATITTEAKGTATGATSSDPDVKSVEDDGYWTISTTLGTVPNYTGTFVTTNFLPSITASSNVTMVRGTTPNFNTQGTGESSGTDQVTASFTTSFGDFAVGNLTVTYTWTGGGVDNNWSTANNWDQGSAPGNGDNVAFTGSATAVYDAGVSTTYYAGISMSGTGNTLTFSGGAIDLSTTPLSVGSGDQVTFNGTSITAYSASQTTFSSGSTVEYTIGTVQADTYHHLTVSNSSGTVTSSGSVVVNGNFTKSNAGTYQADGSVTVAGTTTLSAGTFTPAGGASLNGNIVGNGGQFSATTGTVTLAGSAQQTISGSTDLSFNNLTLNNANGMVLSGQAPTINGTLTFQNGLITTGSNNLYIGTSGSISGASSSLYVNGRLAKIYGGGAQSFTYPVGKGGEYLPVTLDFASLTSGYTRVVELINSDANALDPDIDNTTLSAVSSVRYWEISRVGSGGGISGTVTVTLTYNGNDGVSNTTALDVAQLSTDTNGSAGTVGVWQSIGGNGSGTPTGTITSSGFTTGGDYYTLGDDAANGQDNSLPVQLASFEAIADVDNVTLNWSTASELENQGFNIYRKSVENPEWVMVNEAIIDGQGTYSGESNYSYVDYDVVAGRSYTYKLESVSFNGYVNVEKVVRVDVPLPDTYALFNNYPNPFNPVTHLKFQVKDASRVSIVIYDVNGREIKTLVNKKEYAAGRYEVTWDATDNFSQKVASGVYFYRFTANNFNKMGRMVLLK